MLRLVSLAAILLSLLIGASLQAQTREQKVLADRQKFADDPTWIYNDLPRAMAEAKRADKPILAVLRCLPCEECVKLDDDLVHNHPRLRSLLEKYVCVRLVATNGLDLSLFQFDTDQSFAAFLLNADGAIYGRFGTRSHQTHWTDDVSLEGFARALEGGLALHPNYPGNKDSLAGKRGPAPEFAAPELLPPLKEKYTSKLDYEGKVVQSCIHCHQIGDAQRDIARGRTAPFPEQLIFPHPHPKAIGLVLDPKERAVVVEVAPQSPAAAAGFRPGERQDIVAGQPLLSIADVQWVLHQASPDGAQLPALVQRGAVRETLTLSLPANWRQQDDLSWRVSTWGLRRMTTGGMVLESLSDDERSAAGIAPGKMALRARHVGKFGPHAAAQRAGFRPGDILVRYDGRDDLSRETDLIAHSLRTLPRGKQVAVSLLRDGKPLSLTLPMQP